MNASFLLRLCTIATISGCLAATSLLGCSDDPDPITLNDGDNVLEINQGNNGENQNQNNDPTTNDNQNQNQNNDPPGPGDLETVTVLDDNASMTSGSSNLIEVEVPEGTYSMSITVTDGTPTNMYYVDNWQGPGGFQLVPPGWASAQTQVCHQNCNNRIAMSAAAFSALAPNNPNAKVDPGTHQFQVGAMSMTGGAVPNETVKVTVHAEVVEDGLPPRGTLDLNLFFSGSNGWTASTAENSAEVAQMIDEVDHIYDQVGIDIGQVAYHDVDSSYQIIEDSLSGTGDLSQMFMNSAQATLEGPSVFFVSELRAGFGGMGGQQGGGSILGISGGIPGPVMVDGSRRGGVAVATDSSQGFGAPGIAHVTAHEVGHYLGLFHTTEQAMGSFGGGPSHDPLPDTPEDDPSYLMYYSGQGDLMSEWQGRVMRKNPWVTF